MALTREKLEAREMEAAARKISRYCISHPGCKNCGAFIDNKYCLFLDYAPEDWEKVIADIKEREAAERG